MGGWILDPARSGGTFVEKNCHHFDLLGWLLGSEPERVAAFGGRDVVYRDRPGILDNAWVVIEHRGGKRASLGVSMFSNVHKLQVGILGDEGLIEGELRERTIRIARPGGEGETIAVPDPAAGRIAEHGGADLLQMEDWLDTIARGAPPQVTLADGVRCLLVALAAQRAADTGAVVALDALAEG
ncbi:MAG: Gfo/Idh/MocA family oxidoreductase [Chloroflexota bacterium]|nr:Gfo/Idh/MocA family oxidoreductase [Chloroflexota bacterium]